MNKNRDGKEIKCFQWKCDCTKWEVTDLISKFDNYSSIMENEVEAQSNKGDELDNNICLECNEGKLQHMKKLAFRER